MIKYKYRPLVTTIYLLESKNKIVTISFAYGYIVCFDLYGDFIDSFGDTEKNNKKFKKCGLMIRPRWEKFKLEWCSKGIDEFKIK